MFAMQTPDAWESAPSSRREAKRYRARWKVAMVFDGASGRPIFHTLTHDLSLNGTSVQSASDEKPETALTLLLAPPPIEGTPQKVLRLKAVVMSTSPFRGGFRLGMSFVQDAELDKLFEQLGKYDLSGDDLPSDPQEDALPSLDLGDAA
jgi:hypothetical protein